MTIASQITALANNISDAYDMVAQRGGTVPQRKNAENLDTAIATIPSGGITKDYGTVTIADYHIDWTLTSTPSGLTVTVDPVLFETAYQAHKSTWDPNNRESITVQNYSSGYRIGNDTTTYTLQDLANFGITVTITTASHVYFVIGKGPIVDLSHTTQKTITSLYEYLSLGDFTNDYGSSFYVDETKYPRVTLVNYSFGPDCDTIPNYFLYRCVNFNHDLTVPNGITKIPDSFLRGCSSFTSQVTLPSTVTEIGYYYLAETAISTSPILPASVKKILAYYLYRCDNVTDLDIPGTVEELPPSLGTNMTGLTSVTLHNGSKIIGEQFMYGQNNFTGTITLPDTVEEIGRCFMGNGTRINVPITLPSSLKIIRDQFLGSNTIFNQPLVIPAGVELIENSFMNGCSSFNSSITFEARTNNQPSLTIKNQFMRGCSNFAQPLTFPSFITFDTSSSQYYLNGCNKFTGPLTVNTSSCPNDNYSLATTSNTAAMYTTGVTLKGTYRSSWISALPNRTSSPYRKLINGGA